MRVVFIVPCYNMSENFEVLVESITSQKSEDWSCIMIDDISDDDTWGKISNLQKKLKAKRVPKGFAYNSGTNKNFLNKKDLIKIIHGIKEKDNKI